MYFLMDMTPMTDFDETMMSNFHNYNAFTRMSAQMNQTAIKDKASDSCKINIRSRRRMTKAWSARSSAASPTPTVDLRTSFSTSRNRSLTTTYD